MDESRKEGTARNGGRKSGECEGDKSLNMWGRDIVSNLMSFFEIEQQNKE